MTVRNNSPVGSLGTSVLLAWRFRCLLLSWPRPVSFRARLSDAYYGQECKVLLTFFCTPASSVSIGAPFDPFQLVVKGPWPSIRSCVQDTPIRLNNKQSTSQLTRSNETLRVSRMWGLTAATAQNSLFSFFFRGLELLPFPYARFPTFESTQGESRSSEIAEVPTANCTNE